MNDEAKGQMYRKHKCQFTKNLRENMTYEEKILWQLLRNRNLRGFKFCRQVKLRQLTQAVSFHSLRASQGITRP
ncbi:MAG: DUF559 domain-containing protein [Candidatus Peribacteraceae bacterium]|jgi:very-short-patch-repair endonuclease